ncbi:MAG: two-component system, OmpR family, sensor kinase [Gaiellaceae bacterium]|jgi:signal transduction histidine kinase|nr:two-component system, OmpR family, sensor kinase [Gaiellaceae bacterium]
MLNSLRFRLPALFLAGIALSGLVTSLIALRLFQDFTRNETLQELRQEARGLADLYAEWAVRALDENKAAPTFAASKLEAATGDRLFEVVLVRSFLDSDSGLTRLTPADVGVALNTERIVTFEFEPPGENRPYLAAAYPIRLGGDKGATFSYLIVAKPKAELRETWITLLSRLAIAFLVGLVVVGALALYLSRRITRPVLALSHAMDQVAEGRRDVDVPAVPGAGEISHLTERFREMTAKLAEAEELERNFLMSVSHELRTPLTAIRGHVAALREGVVTDPELAETSLRIVADEAERLGRLVNDVLDLAKLDARRFTVLTEEVDMGTLLERAYSTFADEARRREIDYTNDVDGAPVIVSDGDRVLQIISNLLANAFRWTPDGGKIDVILQSRNGTVSIDVADSGPGIAVDERERIFRPFWSTDGRGTGLGLPIARELAIALGGRIELHSEMGKGSRFRLVLPLRSW